MITFSSFSLFRLHGDAERARKHGMQEFITADPCAAPHHLLFRLLQSFTVTYRLQDPVVSLGKLTSLNFACQQSFLLFSTLFFDPLNAITNCSTCFFEKRKKEEEQVYVTYMIFFFFFFLRSFWPKRLATN